MELIFLLYFTIFYVILARIMKIWSKTVQLHSIFHCVTASVWAGYAIYVVCKGNILTTNVYQEFQHVDDSDKAIIQMVAFHSAGYFIGDIIDIYIDYENVKRKDYVLHHLAAIAGILTVYWDSYIYLYGLWSLELGGIVHHIKHASHVWQFSHPYSTAAELLYHIVYVSTRLMLLLNVTKILYYVADSEHQVVDMICFVSVYTLVIQNFIWWFKNLQSSVVKLEKAM
jgi:hypothetical protein